MAGVEKDAMEWCMGSFSRGSQQEPCLGIVRGGNILREGGRIKFVMLVTSSGFKAELRRRADQEPNLYSHLTSGKPNYSEFVSSIK